MKFFRSHNLDAVLAGEIKVVFGIDLPAQSHLQRVALLDQAFFDGILHRRAVRMRTAEVAAPGVAMGIELNEANRAKVPVNCPKDGQKNGMISADADRARAGAKYVAQLLGNSLVGIFNR